MDMKKKLDELLADKAFVEKLAQMESVEEITEALNAAGIEITVDEMVQAQEMIQNQESGELSAESLDSVAGGSLIGAVIIGGAVWSALSAACGFRDGYNSKQKSKKK